MNMAKSEKEKVAKRTSIVRSAACVLITLSMAVLTQCSFPDFATIFPQPAETPQTPLVTYESIKSDAEQITLQWYAPQSAASGYDVYVRSHGSTEWRIMGSAAAVPEPEYTVLHSSLGNGEYDFAVVAVNDQGDRSSYHSSLDPTAQPETGWYLIWQR